MIEDYLKSYAKASELIVVGPFFAQGSYGDARLHEPCIFADRGAVFRPSANFGFSVGDGDSFEGKLDQILPKDKNESDLAFILQHIPINIRRLRLLGFLGGRKDHEFAVMLDVYRVMLQKQVNEVVWDKGEVIFLKKTSKHFNHHGTFSVFSFEEGNVVISGSIRYPFEGSLQPMSSHGLSNEADGAFSITVASSCFIFFR